MRRALGLGAALVLAAGGVVLLLLAVDVNRVEGRLAADDVAYRTAPARTDLWRAPLEHRQTEQREGSRQRKQEPDRTQERQH